MSTNERDALLALADQWQKDLEEDEQNDVSKDVLTVERIYIKQLREALAAPAEGDGAVCDHESSHAAPWRCAKCGYRFDNTRPAATAVVPRPSDDELWDQTLRERDDAEKALGDMFQAVTGRSAEWSSAWHYKDAIEEVEDHMAMLAAAPAAPKGGVVDEAEAAYLQSLGDDPALDGWYPEPLPNRKQADPPRANACATFLRDFIAEYEEHEEDEWSAAWQGLADRARALATGEQP